MRETLIAIAIIIAIEIVLGIVMVILKVATAIVRKLKSGED